MQSLQQQRQPLLQQYLSKQEPSSFCDVFRYQNVNDFLNRSHLTQYLDIFLSEGFDSVTSLLEITEEDMIFMGVKRGHRRLIQREIASAKGLPRDQPLVTNMMTSGPFITNTLQQQQQQQQHIDLFMSNKQPSDTNTNFYSSSPINNMTASNTLNTTSNNNNNNIPSYNTHTIDLTSPCSMNSALGSSMSGNSSSGTMTALRYKLNPHNYKNNGGNSSNNNKNNNKNHDSGSGGDMSNSSSNDNNNSSSATLVNSGSAMSDNHSNSISSNDDEDSIDTNGSVPNKRKYRRHPKPDRHAPVKPPSAYIMFSNDSRAQLKDKNLSFAELAKIVGDQWKNLSHMERRAYERKAMHAKDEYLAFLEQYRQTPLHQRYQEYLKEFKVKQDDIDGARKRHKQKSPGSGSIADFSSNGNSNGSGSGCGSSGSGSADAYGDNEAVMRRQRRVSNNHQSSQSTNSETEIEDDTAATKNQTKDQSSQSYNNDSTSNDQQEPGWNYRSNQIMRGMLPVEFVHTITTPSPAATAYHPGPTSSSKVSNNSNNSFNNNHNIDLYKSSKQKEKEPYHYNKRRSPRLMTQNNDNANDNDNNTSTSNL